MGKDSKVVGIVRLSREETAVGRGSALSWRNLPGTKEGNEQSEVPAEWPAGASRAQLGTVPAHKWRTPRWQKIPVNLRGWRKGEGNLLNTSHQWPLSSLIRKAWLPAQQICGACHCPRGVVPNTVHRAGVLWLGLSSAPATEKTHTVRQPRFLWWYVRTGSKFLRKNLHFCN